jgi:hypothetical protein
LARAQFQKNDLSSIAVLTNPGGSEVTLPDAGSYHRLPSTLGAGLVVVYRVAGYEPTVLPLAYSQPKLPLKSIVIYDGGVTLNSDTLQVPMEGFYEASRSAPNAKLTQIVGNGRPGLSDTVQVTSTLAAADNRLVATNPFTGSGAGNSGSSATGIDVLTFPLPLEPGAMKAGISVSANGDSSKCGCLIFGASVLSTVVQDRDGDGLLDVWEAQSEWSPTAHRRLGSDPGDRAATPDGQGDDAYFIVNVWGLRHSLLQHKYAGWRHPWVRRIEI